MAKRGRSKTGAAKEAVVVQNEAPAQEFQFGFAPGEVITPEKIQNTLSQFELMGVGGGHFPWFFPENQGSPFSQQISQATTGFVNLRWYLISNMRQFISELYVEIGLVQTIVNVPVDDGLRGGIEIKSKELDEEQIKFLLGSLDRDNDLDTAGWGAKWDRLFGGAGILILTDQDPRKPLRMDKITADTPLEFRAVDMWELFWDKQNTEGYDPTTQTEDFEYYNYYGEQVHKSRVMRMKGLTAPSFIRPRLRGWGFSVVEALVRSMNQYLKSTDLLFEVLDEFKIDIYKFKNLVNILMSPNGKQKVAERVGITNYNKNYQNAVVLDSEDDYQSKPLSFAGLGDAMQQIRMQVAADMRMPMTKLFGLSASGFNSGEDDIEVYNAMVESQVRNKLKYIILRMVEIKCQKFFGFVPKDLSITFAPLREMSATDQEAVKTSQFNRASKAFTDGAISLEEYRDTINRDELLGMTLQDVPNELRLRGYMDASVTEGANNPYNPQDLDNPGAGRLDTQKSKATEVGGIGKDVVKKQPAPRDSGEPQDIAKAPETAQNSQTDISWLKPYSFLELASRMFNSIAFDKAAYELDGGDNWIDPRRRVFFENPGNVDEALWAKAKQASRDAFGEEKWQFVTWLYKKWGGKFN